MLGTVYFSRFRRAVSRFAGANQGNVALIFAASVIPILGLVGTAIDYSRTNNARSSMQAALDSVALMVAKDLTNGTIKTEDVKTKSQTYFTAIYNNPDATSVVVDGVHTAGSGSTPSTVVVTGSGSVKTQFLKIPPFNLDKLNFKMSSTSTWGSTRMRVAMVLDNTGSMDDNGKMEAMQAAAKEMIDTLSNYNKQTGDVYISVIPFSKHVNVDTANVDASWINWTEWEAEPPILATKPANWDTTRGGSDCPFNYYTHGIVCMDRPATMSGATYVADVPSSGTYAGYICPSIDFGNKLPGKAGVYYNGCYTTTPVPGAIVASGGSASCGATPNCSCTGNGSSKVCRKNPTSWTHTWRGATAAAPAHSTWTGCVNDRDQSYDTLNTAPGSGGGTPSTQFYAEQSSACLSAKVAKMSNSWSTLKTQITNMVPNGNTNQAIGLAWGWQSLSTTNGPIAAPAKDSNWQYKDYIVLLSDGLNTQNRWSANQATIDARQKILCENIKADKVNPVTVFTIQVNINNKDAKSTVLEECATNGNFQMITTTSQTSDAFKNILTQISKLRVSK